MEPKPASTEWPDPAAFLRHQQSLDRIPRPGHVWVVCNMVVSLDGAIALDGRSGPLGTRADKLMFTALRSCADVILVGAGTARAERYRLPENPPEVAEQRIAAGRWAHPRLAIVSRSLRLGSDLPAVTAAGPGDPPLVLTNALAPPPAGRCEVVRLEGDDGPDIHAMLEYVSRLGARIVLCEGGPRLLGSLAAADAIDEFHLTVSPILVGGEDHGALRSPVPTPRVMRLGETHTIDGTLFVRALRASTPESGLSPSAG